MNKTITMRATEDDIATIKLQAQRKGKDMSQFLRDILIAERVINPMGVAQENNNF